MNFGYPSSEDDVYGVCALGNEKSPDHAPPHDLRDLGAPVTGLGGSQDWYLNPTPEEHVGHSGYPTLLDTSRSQFVNSHATHPNTCGSHDTAMGIYGLHSHERAVNVSARSAGPSVADLATTPSSIGPITLPQVPPHFRDDPFPTPSYAADLSHSARTSNHQPVHPRLAGSLTPTPPFVWTRAKSGPRTISPPLHPASTGDDAWQYQRPRTTQDYGIPPSHTVPGVLPNTDFPTPIAPSYGPQRSTAAKGKRKAIQGGRDKQKRDSAESLPEGVSSSWDQTKDRFVWELLNIYYFRPAGRSINPGMAFDLSRKAMKEDLHRSPLAAQAAKAKVNKKEARVYEQYLTHILMGLLRSRAGETQNEVLMYTRVLQKLASELVPINERRVLREGHSSAKDPNELDNSRTKAEHREAEKGRRAAIRRLQDQISVFFLVQRQKKILIGELLPFVVIYLRIGEHAFPGLVRPRPRSHWQSS